MFKDPVMKWHFPIWEFPPAFLWQLKSMDVLLSSALKVQHLADGSKTFSPEVLALGICFLVCVCVKTWLSLFNLRQWCKAHLFLKTFPWRSDLECIYIPSWGCAFLMYLADAFGLICGLVCLKVCWMDALLKQILGMLQNFPIFNLWRQWRVHVPVYYEWKNNTYELLLLRIENPLRLLFKIHKSVM